MGREILVAIEHAGGTAGVIRDGHGLMLAGSIADGGGTGIDDYRPTRTGLWPQATLTGGMLPTGAVAARVTGVTSTCDAATGGGAWAAVLQQSPHADLAACFLDASGALVRPPLPERWPRIRVDDADEPCPACGGAIWEQVTADDDSRGTSGRGRPGSRMRPSHQVPTPFVVCVACGHEDPIGVWFAPYTPADVTPQEAERAQREWEHRERATQRDALAKVSFPLYVVDGLEMQIRGWGGNDHATSHVRLEHDTPERTISVDTDADELLLEPDDSAARTVLAQLLDARDEWPERSDAGRSIWLRHREREQARTAAAAHHQRAPITVDGVPREFAVADAGDRWVAVGAASNGALRLTIAARGVPRADVRLRVLNDALDALGLD